LFGLALWSEEFFIGLIIIYGISITLMCIIVKEGEYPPPIKEEHAHWWSGIRNYAVECFGHRIYLLIFAAYAFSVCAGGEGYKAP
jgi:hypothetical protein